MLIVIYQFKIDQLILVIFSHPIFFFIDYLMIVWYDKREFM